MWRTKLKNSFLPLVKYTATQYKDKSVNDVEGNEIAIIFLPPLMTQRTTRTHTHARARTHTHTHAVKCTACVSCYLTLQDASGAH